MGKTSFVFLLLLFKLVFKLLEVEVYCLLLNQMGIFGMILSFIQAQPVAVSNSFSSKCFGGLNIVMLNR